MSWGSFNCRLRLNSIHNLTYYLDLMREFRAAIERGAAQQHVAEAIAAMAAGC